VQERDEGMRDGGSELSRVEFVGESVEGKWILSEVGDVEYGFWIREIESCEVGVKACGWRAKVGDTGGGGDSCTRLFIHDNCVNSLNSEMVEGE